MLYRYPNLKSVRELVYKRGYGKVNGQRIPLTDNSIIEKCLGKHCMFFIIVGLEKMCVSSNVYFTNFSAEDLAKFLNILLMDKYPLTSALTRPNI